MLKKNFFAKILLLFSFNTIMAKNIIVYVNGNNDCCTWGMKRVRKAINPKMDYTFFTSWAHFKRGHEFGAQLSDKWKKRFVSSGITFLKKQPHGTNVYIIAHSWGADSAYRLVNEYNRNNINFRLLALIDAVGPGGMRRNMRNATIPKKVDYFFNRWQENQPFPNDFKVDGKLSCRAKKCDQKEQSFHYNANGSPVKKKCGWHEFGCKGRVENPFDGWHPGYKKKRTGHQGLPHDGLVEATIIRIINKLLKTRPTPRPRPRPNPRPRPVEKEKIFKLVNNSSKKLYYAYKYKSSGRSDFLDYITGWYLLKPGQTVKLSLYSKAGITIDDRRGISYSANGKTDFDCVYNGRGFGIVIEKSKRFKTIYKLHLAAKDGFSESRMVRDGKRNCHRLGDNAKSVQFNVYKLPKTLYFNNYNGPL